MKYINEYNDYEKKLFNATENIKHIKANKLYEILIKYLNDKNIKYSTLKTDPEKLSSPHKRPRNRIIFTLLGNSDDIIIVKEVNTDKIIEVAYRVTAKPDGYYIVTLNTIHTFKELFKLIDKHVIY